MLPLVFAAVAVLAGIVIGFILRGGAAKAECARLEAGLAERAREVAEVRADLAQAQAESAARAGFEALAVERERNIAQLTGERDQARADVQAKVDSERTLAARVEGLEAELRAERQSLAEKVALLEEAKKTLADKFEALAGEILEKKSKSFSEGSQKELGTLLEPLKAQLKDFREKVEKAQSDSNTGVTKLETLIGALSGLNQQLAEEARSLSTALRGSAKAQGDWGEFILRDLLEMAGLREGEQYSFQQSFAGVENGDGDRARTVRTDVILILPGGRCLVIDSKVSLTAYTDFVRAEAEADRSAALKLHLASVRGHVMGLSKAGYHRLPGMET